MDDPDRAGPSVEIDPRRLELDDDIETLADDLRTLLETQHLSLIKQLVASPTASLTLPELEARNPDVPSSTLYSRLNTLAERDRPLVIKLKPDVESVEKGYPQVYYAASERAVELLKQVSLFEGCYRMMELYEHVPLEHPNKEDRDVTIKDIENYEHRPIPEWATEPI